MSARLHSLEEIDTHRSGFADAARMVLVNANGKVGQMGALADFLEVEPKYERPAFSWRINFRPAVT